MIPAHDMVGAGSTVYLGFPIWWMAPVWLVNDSVKSNDFAGKTIIPFCTSASSDIGNSASTLQKMAGSGTWLTGHRFSESVSEKDVTDWLISPKTASPNTKDMGRPLYVGCSIRGAE